RFFNEVYAGEHTSALAADEFHSDYLSERTGDQGQESGAREEAPGSPAGGQGGHRSPVPVSGFARHVRLRRRLDTAWTLAALHRGLARHGDPQRREKVLPGLEDLGEAAGPAYPDGPAALGAALADVERGVAAPLAGRLLARAAAEQPGYLVLNPCSFARRVALELDGATLPLPIS